MSRPTREQLEQWGSRLVGAAVFPWSPGYDKARQGDPLYPASPEVIGYCVTPSDVKHCLELARTWGYAVTCRSGGHSTAGFSVNDGLVIDVSRISYVSVDPAARLARVGAGTAFRVLDSVLNSYRLHVPTGGCGTVCVGGFVQGGGYGFTSRMFGMNSDNVVQVTVMRVDGTIVVADAQQERELFWGVRGGTGNNFGVLLEVVYRLTDLWRVRGFAVRWDRENAPAGLDLLQRSYMRGATDARLGHQVALATIKGEIGVAMIGMYDGSDERLRETLAPLLATGGDLVVDKEGSYAGLNEPLLLELLDPPTDSMLELKQAGYLVKQLGVDGWDRVLERFAATPNAFNLALIEVYGAAIEKVPVSSSAFVHREVDGDFFVDSFFEDGGDFTQRPEAQEWLDSMFEAMDPYLNGHVYQNYPSRGLADYRSAYFGPAAERLARLRATMDPDGVLRFPQSV